MLNKYLITSGMEIRKLVLIKYTTDNKKKKNSIHKYK